MIYAYMHAQLCDYDSSRAGLSMYGYVQVCVHVRYCVSALLVRVLLLSWRYESGRRLALISDVFWSSQWASGEDAGFN